MKQNFSKLVEKLLLPPITAIGVDIQDKHLTFTALTVKDGEKSRFLATEKYALSEEAIEGGELKKSNEIGDAIKSFMAKLAQRESKLLKALGLGEEPIFVLSIPPNRVFAETLFFEDIEESDIVEAVRSKISSTLPWPLADAYVDWEYAFIEEIGKYAVFVVSIKKEFLNGYLKPFIERGLKVGAVEFHLYSLAHAVRNEEGGVSVLISSLIDEDGIEFAFIHKGIILAHYIYSREEAGDKFDKKGNQVVIDKILYFKNYVETNFKLAPKVLELIDIVSEENLSQSIGAKTKLKVQTRVLDSESDPNALISQGAALRPYTYSSDSKLLNLAPKETGGRYNENLFFRLVRFLLRFSVSAAVVFLIALLGTFWLVTGYTRLIKLESGALGEIQVELPVENFKTRVGTFNNRVTLIQSASGRRAQASAFIDEINRAAETRSALLERIEFSPGRAILVFRVPLRDDAVGLREDLVQSKLFTSVSSIPVSELARERDLTLNLTAQIDGEGLKKLFGAPPSPSEVPIELPEVPPVEVPEIEEVPEVLLLLQKLEIMETPTGWLRVRSLPSTAGEEIGRVNPGETFQYLEVRDNWYEIVLTGGETGWVSGDYVKLLENVE